MTFPDFGPLPDYAEYRQRNGALFDDPYTTEDEQFWGKRDADDARHAACQVPLAAERARGARLVLGPADPFEGGAPGSRSADAVQRAKVEQRRKMRDQERAESGRLPLPRATTPADALAWLDAHKSYNAGPA